MNQILHHNRNAIIAIPQYLLIIVILLLILLPILFYGAGQIQRQTQINQLKKDLQTMMISADLLSQYADHASRLTKDITIPQSVRYVSFQSQENSQENISNYLNWSSTYQICYDDGSIEKFQSPNNIIQSPPNRLYQGTHQIIVELINIKDKTYVTMQTIE